MPQPCKVVVVDDNRDFVDSAAMLLEMEGHEVRLAYSAQAAVDLARDFNPHVVVMDIALPGKNGIDLGKEIQQILPDCRIIVVTGFTREDIRLACEKAGFQEFLIKPVDPKVMNQVVGEQCADAEACNGTEGTCRT